MSWLLPGFLAAALAIGLPILLHFLRSRPKTQIRFPSLRLLGPSAVRDTRRQRIQRWLTLLLRCLVIALIAAAFARPFFAAMDASGRRVLLIAMDNSMSMRAGSRWEERKAWAVRQLAELRPGDQAGLLWMNPSPTWLAPITDDLDAVAAALHSAKPGYEKTSYEGALRMAADALASHPAGARILAWMADEQLAGWAGADFATPLPAGVEFRFADPAPEPKNQAAITALRWTPARDALEAQIELFQPANARRTLTVTAADRTLATKDVELAEGRNFVRIPVTPGKDPIDGVRVQMPPDDLPADDTAWISAAHEATLPVFLDAPAGADFIAHALEATHDFGAEAMEPRPFAGDALPAGSVLIARDAATFREPLRGKLDAFLHAGGPALVFVNGSPEQAAWLKEQGIGIEGIQAPPDEPLHLRNWDMDHPILAPFADESVLPLLDIGFTRGFRLKGAQLSPIAAWPDGSAAIAEAGVNGRRLLLAGFSPDRTMTQWPVQPSFVPFVHQSVRWLASLGDHGKEWRVGDSIPLPVEKGVWRALDSPAGRSETQTAGPGIRAEAPGLFEFVADGQRKIFAVNTVPGESNLLPWPDASQIAALQSKSEARPAAAPVRTMNLSAEFAESQQRIWWWLLAICGLVLLAEITLANRTAL